MMDTILNLGLNDAAVEGLKARTGTAGSPTTATAASSRCSATSCSRFRRRSSSTSSRPSSTRTARRSTPTSTRHGLQETVDRYKKLVKKETGKPFPQDPVQQLRRRARRRVPLLEQPARDRTTAASTRFPDHIGTAVNVQKMVFGNTGDRSATGVGLHAQPGDGREGVLRRVPRQRPGRGRRGRHPDAAADRRAGKRDAEGLQGAARSSRRASRSTTRTSRTSSSRSRTRSSSCCRRAAASAPATPRSSSPPTSWPRSWLTPRGGAAAGRARVAVAAARADVRPGGVEEGAGGRPRGLPASPGAASGQVVFTAEQAVAWTEQGKKVAARPEGDRAGRHPRHGSRAGHPDRDRRHDVARRRRRPADGPAVGRRRGRAAHRREGQGVLGGRPDRQGGRLRLVRRPHRRSEDRQGRDQAERDPPGARRQDEARGVGHLPAASARCSAGPTRSARWASAPTPTSRTSPSWRTPSARAASGCAAPSTCSSARAASRRCSA